MNKLTKTGTTNKPLHTKILSLAFTISEVPEFLNGLKVLKETKTPMNPKMKDNIVIPRNR